MPYPDHVIVDLRQGTARIIGPATKEDKQIYDAAVDDLANLLWLEHGLKDDLARARGRSQKAAIEDILGKLRAKVDAFQSVLPPDLLAKAEAKAEQKDLDFK